MSTADTGAQDKCGGTLGWATELQFRGTTCSLSPVGTIVCHSDSRYQTPELISDCSERASDGFTPYKKVEEAHPPLACVPLVHLQATSDAEL